RRPGRPSWWEWLGQRCSRTRASPWQRRSRPIANPWARAPRDLRAGACRCCRGRVAGRGRAVARAASATCSRPCPRPKKSWVALLGCLGLEERVQAALRLGLPGPAAAPLVAAGERRPRARGAADARVPLLEERMGGDTVTLEVVERVLRRPRRQRVHLVEGALLELLDDR